MPIRVLMIDDDPQLAELLAAYLRPHDVLLTNAPDGARGLRALEAGGFDAVVLDVMMPGLDGLDVLRRLRASSALPVLMLTARGDETDRVVGLELGADDYLAKPVRPRLLLARIHSLLRRIRGGAPAPERPGDRVAVGDLVVDAKSRVVTMAGETVTLTTAEFDLLWLMAKNAGEVLSREQIYRDVRGIEYDGLDRSIDLRMARLRKKLGDDANNPRYLKSIRGVGYLLALDP